MAVSKRLRFEILRRDNRSCYYCGRTPPEVKLTIDHVVPEALGGTDDPGNLVAACGDCNGGKSSVPADAPLVANVAADALRWSQAMQLAADELAGEEDVLEAICQAVHTAWKPRYIPADYRSSVYQFVKAGLTESDLVDLARTALAARWVDDRWTYFCGCCWKRVKQRQERAREIILAREQGPSELPANNGLPTAWTAAEVEEFESSAVSYVRDLIGDERLDRIVNSPSLPPCQHGVMRHCGDPVCAVEDASLLMATAQRIKEHIDRDDAVCAAADALLELEEIA